jgi:hypothetical protein
VLQHPLPGISPFDRDSSDSRCPAPAQRHLVNIDRFTQHSFLLQRISIGTRCRGAGQGGLVFDSVASCPVSLDDSDHLPHNHHASVASLRLLFTFAPERRSASLRNQRSPSVSACSEAEPVCGVEM